MSKSNKSCLKEPESIFEDSVQLCFQSTETYEWTLCVAADRPQSFSQTFLDTKKDKYSTPEISPDCTCHDLAKREKKAAQKKPHTRQAG